MPFDPLFFVVHDRHRQLRTLAAPARRRPAAAHLGLRSRVLAFRRDLGFRLVEAGLRLVLGGHPEEQPRPQRLPFPL